MSDREFGPVTLAHARSIYLALSGDAQKTKREIRAETGLTHGQFVNGMACLTHALQVHLGQPIGYDPRTYCYFLPGTLEEASPWIVNRLADTRTRLTTQRQTLLACAQAFPEHERSLRWWEHQLGRLQDDLAGVLTDLEAVA